MRKRDLIILTAAALWICWAFNRAAAQTPAELAAVIDCQVRQQSPGMYAKRAPVYYRPEQLVEYATAALDALKAQRWPAGQDWQDYLLLMISTVYQQSKWLPDAVSRYNRDEKGRLIRVDKRTAWRRPDPRLDYGLFQMHWSTVRRMAQHARIGDLAVPATNLRLGAAWLSSRADDCRRWLRKRVRCARSDWSVTCRCKRTYISTGGMGYAGTTRTLLSTFVPLTIKCVKRVLGRAEEG